MVIRLVTVVALVACSADPRMTSRAQLSECACPCSVADAAVPDVAADAAPDAAADAPPDAPPTLPPLAIDPVAPWPMVTLIAGAQTGVYRGADGVAWDAFGCLVTAWEEGGAVTRVCQPAAPELVATGLAGVEDAKAADLDGDGTVDIVSCSDGGGRCYVTFRGSPNVTVTLTASQGHNRIMQAAIADMNGDGLLDIVFGTRVGTYANPAVIAVLENPGPVSARNGTAWTYRFVDLAGWTMSLLAFDVDSDGDVDIVTSDRSFTLAANNVREWGRNGARWLEQTPTGWVNHRISAPTGACPISQPMCTDKTPGDEMFLTVDGNDVWDCQSSDSASYSRIVRHHTEDWLSWTHEVLPAMANVGHCQGVAIADVDRDGGKDVVVSNWKGNSLPLPPSVAMASGIYWIRRTATGWTRMEISGQTGVKYDNVLLDDMDGDGDLDAITSEQVSQLGVVVYLNPGVAL